MVVSASLTCIDGAESRWQMGVLAPAPDLAGYMKALTAAGYTGRQEPYDAFFGARYAVVRDPAGNDVGLMSPMASCSPWSPRPGGSAWPTCSIRCSPCICPWWSRSRIRSGPSTASCSPPAAAIRACR